MWVTCLATRLAIGLSAIKGWDLGHIMFLLLFLHISKVNEIAHVFHPPLQLQSTQLIKTITHKD